jgi:hypothetical protein
MIYCAVFPSWTRSAQSVLPADSTADRNPLTWLSDMSSVHFFPTPGTGRDYFRSRRGVMSLFGFVAAVPPIENGIKHAVCKDGQERHLEFTKQWDAKYE